ncbi:MAG: hypothetical protein ACHQJ6_07005 [Candidatus Berkiellales bacterium]
MLLKYEIHQDETSEDKLTSLVKELNDLLSINQNVEAKQLWLMPDNENHNLRIFKMFKLKAIELQSINAYIKKQKRKKMKKLFRLHRSKKLRLKWIKMKIPSVVGKLISKKQEKPEKPIA